MRALRLVGQTVGIGLLLTIFRAVPSDAAHGPSRTPTGASPTIYVGTQKVRAPAVIDHGRVLVPVRGVFEAIGARVSFSAPHFVVVRKDGAVIAAFILGRMSAIAGRRAVELDAAPMRRDGRVYVPLRVVAEAAGATVAYTSRPPVVHIRQRAEVLAVNAAPSDMPPLETTAEPDSAQRSSSASWRMGVAVFTGLCCLGCLALTARRFGPSLFRPVPAKRAASVVQPDVESLAVPPTDFVALSSVEAIGEARFHKEVVTETRTIEVPVTREELVIEYSGDGGTVIIQGRTLEAGETVRIPLWEERVQIDVTKHVVLKEDIVIDKRRITALPERPQATDLDLAEGSPS